MSEGKKAEGAARYNGTKTQFHYNLPLVDDIKARVSMFGAVKYESWNWTKGGNLTTPFNSLSRHIRGIQRGEWLDPDSCLPHAAHIAWNGDQMLQWYYTDRRVDSPSDTGVMVWDLPVYTYREQLKIDLSAAEARLAAAKEEYAAARKAAGLT